MSWIFAVLGGISMLIHVVPWQTNSIFSINTLAFVSSIIARNLQDCNKGFSLEKLAKIFDS